jgi:hypothetical protein
MQQATSSWCMCALLSLRPLQLIKFQNITNCTDKKLQHADLLLTIQGVHMQILDFERCMQQK